MPKRPGKVESQFIRLLDSALENNGTPKEEFFTKTLYNYFQRECGFGKGLNRSQFYEEYFQNPIAEQSLLMAFMEETGCIHPENPSKGNKWYIKNIYLNGIISCRIEEHGEIFEVLEYRIEGEQLQTAIRLLELCGLIIDLEEETIEIIDASYYDTKNIPQINLATILLRKFDYLFERIPPKICSIAESYIEEIKNIEVEK